MPRDWHVLRGMRAVCRVLAAMALCLRLRGPRVKRLLRPAEARVTPEPTLPAVSTVVKVMGKRVAVVVGPPCSSKKLKTA